MLAEMGKDGEECSSSESKMESGIVLGVEKDG